MSQVSDSIKPHLTFDTAAAEALAAPLSPGQLAWRRFKRHRMAVVGSLGLIVMMIFIITGSFFYTEKYSNFNDPANRLAAPAPDHYFGTDSTGRDLFARIIYGGQIS